MACIQLNHYLVTIILAGKELVLKCLLGNSSQPDKGQSQYLQTHKSHCNQCQAKRRWDRSMKLRNPKQLQCLSVSQLLQDRTYQEDMVHIESRHQY